MASLPRSATFIRSRPRQSSRLTRHQTYLDRWRDVQFDGSLERVDRGVEEMTRLIAMLDDPDADRDELLDELEALAFGTAVALPKVLALDPTRCVEPPFDVPGVLTDAVAQYLSGFPDEAWHAIIAGAGLASSRHADALPLEALSLAEQGYRGWATSRLLPHLILDLEGPRPPSE